MNTFGINSIINMVIAFWPLWLLMAVLLIIKIIFEIWLPNTIKKWKNKRRFQKGEAWRSDKHLLVAENKMDDLTIKRLTKNAPSVADRFKELDK